MSSKNYLKVISDHKGVVIICVILVGLLAFIFAQIKPVSYNVFLSLSAHRINREETADFQYDSYYAIEAAGLITNTVVNWLTTENTVLDIYKKAGLEPDVPVNKLSRKFKARQLSSHTTRVVFNYKDQQGANKLAAALVNVIQDKVKGIERTSKDEPSFGIQASFPVVIQHKINPILACLCGLVSGLFVGIGLAFLFKYFKKEE